MNGVAPQCWKGYTLAQLRNQRIINQAHIVIERAQFSNSLDALKARKASRMSMLRRMMGALNVIDYSVMGLAVARRVHALASSLRKR